eukprot:TRINITY_DN111751_c0_g1_i1.p1 TRINITY_DN111751_c0_g1~~TRINITY_DN111751_c0_g1_i1.p1  ORF type:complete len:398 (-),score=53.71 TRINITY_DN111751_c0_g1_i1:161-1354(-)
MVVTYETTGDESLLSFLNIPRILLRHEGSVIKCILPHMFVTFALSVLAVHVHNEELIGPWVDAGIGKAQSTLSFLLAFLLVFKTQSAYTQFWAATGHVDTLLEESRLLGMTAVAVLQAATQAAEASGVQADEAKQTGATETPGRLEMLTKQLLRLIAAHYFVVVEYLLRSPMNDDGDDLVLQATLRSDVTKLLSLEEQRELYPNGQHDRSADPTIVHLWMQICLSQLGQHYVAPLNAGMMMTRLGNLVKAFWAMNKIDRTQFPLPYAQIVKLLLLIYVCSVPFHLVSACGNMTPFISVLVAVGFFGLDCVAEVLETPFGHSPNDINLRLYGRKLLKHLTMMDERSKNSLNHEVNLKKISDEYYADTDASPLIRSQRSLIMKTNDRHAQTEFAMKMTE